MTYKLRQIIFHGMGDGSLLALLVKTLDTIEPTTGTSPFQDDAFASAFSLLAMICMCLFLIVLEVFEVLARIYRCYLTTDSYQCDRAVPQ